MPNLRPRVYASFQNRTDRAAWSIKTTTTFYQLYCEQMNLGYCPQGKMTKWGWKNMIEAFYQKEKVVHDNKIFGHKYRELKKMWLKQRKLQLSQTGLGRNPDGSVAASDGWWADNHPGTTQVKNVVMCTCLMTH
jgi:hypothetical protein